MKLKLSLLSVLFFLIQNSSVYAKSYGYHLPKGSSYGRTHSVKPYFKKNGTFVQRHRSANPRSGVHCQNNVCY